MSRIKLILSSAVIALFMGNYKLCDYFYSEDINKWWILRTNIYAIIFALSLTLARIDTIGVQRLILSIGIGLSVSDVIDRLVFNSNVFNYSDIFMIIITVSISIYDYVRN